MDNPHYIGFVCPNDQAFYFYFFSLTKQNTKDALCKHSLRNFRRIDLSIGQKLQNLTFAQVIFHCHCEPEKSFLA
jgi:hypothetical protein